MKGFDLTRLPPSEEDRIVQEGERLFAPLTRQRMELFALLALQKAAPAAQPPQAQSAPGPMAGTDGADAPEGK